MTKSLGVPRAGLSSTATFFTVFHNYAGLTLLSYPYAFVSAGWLLALVVLALMVGVALFTAGLLLWISSRADSSLSFAQIAHQAAGDVGWWAVTIVCAAEMALGLVISQTVAWQNLGFIIGRERALPLGMLLSVLLTRLDTFRKLEWVSVAGSASIVTICAVVICLYLINGEGNGDESDEWRAGTAQGRVPLANWDTAPTGLCILIGLIGGHTVLLPLCQEMRAPADAPGVLAAAFGLIFLLAAATGYAGSMTYGYATGVIITDNISQHVSGRWSRRLLHVVLCCLVGKVLFAAAMWNVVLQRVCGLVRSDADTDAGQAEDRTLRRELPKTALSVGAIIASWFLTPYLDYSAAALGSCCLIVSIFFPISCFVLLRSQRVGPRTMCSRAVFGVGTPAILVGLFLANLFGSDHHAAAAPTSEALAVSCNETVMALADADALTAPCFRQGSNRAHEQRRSSRRHAGRTFRAANASARAVVNIHQVSGAASKPPRSGRPRSEPNASSNAHPTRHLDASASEAGMPDRPRSRQWQMPQTNSPPLPPSRRVPLRPSQAKLMPLRQSQTLPQPTAPMGLFRFLQETHGQPLHPRRGPSATTHKKVPRSTITAAMAAGNASRVEWYYPPLHEASQQHCAEKENFLARLAARMKSWQEQSYLMKNGLWQASVNNKFIGYIFASALHIATPRLLACQPAGRLPDYFPRGWGSSFVMKAMSGFSSEQVSVISVSHKGGTTIAHDRFSGKHIHRPADAMASWRRLTDQTSETMVMVEEKLVRNGGGDGVPADYKFFVFGSLIGAVAVIYGRKTPVECAAWYNEKFERIDNGCVMRDEGDTEQKNIYRHCPKGWPPRPASWSELCAVAARLGGALGVHMRIDLFDTTHGVVLGEFTPWHAKAKQHCAMPKDKPTSTSRSCVLGSLWHHSLGPEGGQHRREARVQPPKTVALQALVPEATFKFKPRELCKLAMQAQAEANFSQRVGRIGKIHG